MPFSLISRDRLSAREGASIYRFFPRIWGKGMVARRVVWTSYPPSTNADRAFARNSPAACMTSFFIGQPGLQK